MFDYGIIQHTDYTSIGDDYDPISNRHGFYDTSYAMPCRILEGYISPAELDGTVVSLRYHLRSVMLGWCTVMMRIDEWTSAQFNDAITQFTIYKNTIRPQVRDGNLYHVSDRPSPTGWDAYEYYTPATGKGVVFAFRSASCSQGAPTLLLKGLEPAADYYVSFQDGSTSAFTASGQYLMETGVMVPLPTAPSSELVYINKQ
jgi:hypothetical protein